MSSLSQYLSNDYLFPQIQALRLKLWSNEVYIVFSFYLCMLQVSSLSSYTFLHTHIPNLAPWMTCYIFISFVNIRFTIAF
jgi:hypothetical protein